MSLNLMDKKLEYWEHQLLDLGKRNKMINYRETKRTTIKLVEPSFGELFYRLALNEETLTFQRSVDRETDVRVFSILSLLENLSASLPVTIGDIKTEGSVLERQRTLKNLRAKSRLAQEEQGTNILYLSFGFVEWKTGKGASAQWIKSPLILVPAVLALEALNSPYTLKKHEDDIVVNPTLEYYLKTEYGIELPQFDADKETLDDYLKSLEGIADQRGWRILREVSLGLLSFLKISMYNDLLKNEERIKKNPVIRAMSGDATEANDIPEHLRDFNLDSISTQDCYQVMSADSSQHDAMIIEQSIKTFINFVEAKDPNTKGHSERVAEISYALAKEMGYSSRECNDIRCIALMHDCGKIAVPVNILQKPSRLTDEEYEIIKKHTTTGGEMLRDFSSIEGMSLGALYHHERYDGKGYPNGLSGEDIPVIARMICVADSLDAMNSNRCYRSRLTKEIILDELIKNKGKQFDPAIVEHVLKLIKQGVIKIGE